MRFSAVVLTVSDRAARGDRVDTSGPAAAAALPERVFDVQDVAIVPDEQQEIAGYLRRAVDRGVCLVLTTGGTGFAPRDVTPEATSSVIERRADSIAEAIRAASLAKTPFAMLSRGVAGIAGRTLIINLPGSPKAVEECLAVVVPVLPHALKLLAGDPSADAEHNSGGIGSQA